jgi:hypothetical protein
MTQITSPRLRAGRLAVALAASAALFAVLCAALANTASANVPDLIRVPASSATDSSSAKSATASCGVRRRLIGTAAMISGGDGQVVLLAVRPNPELTAVTVRAHEDDDGTTANWSVTATAICANIPGLELVAASYDTPNGPSADTADGLEAKSGHAYCPAGKRVVGAGGEVTGQTWGDVVLDGIDAHWTLGFVMFKAEEQTPIYNSAWGLTGYAICADPLPGLELVGAETPLNSIGGKIVTASCPSGKKLLGATGDIEPAPEWVQPWHNAAGKVGMVQLGPLNPLTQSVTVVALEDQSATTDDWTADAGAICASS